MKYLCILAIAVAILSGCHSTVRYRGILPAADCSGIEYSLSLDTGKHIYSLETRYIDADGPGKDVRFTSYGSYEVIGGSADSSKYFRLISKSDRDTIYFKKVDGKTLRLVNDDLQEPMHPENYEITVD